MACGKSDRCKWFGESIPNLRFKEISNPVSPKGSEKLLITSDSVRLFLSVFLPLILVQVC